MGGKPDVILYCFSRIPTNSLVIYRSCSIRKPFAKSTRFTVDRFLRIVAIPVQQQHSGLVSSPFARFLADRPYDSSTSRVRLRDSLFSLDFDGSSSLSPRADSVLPAMRTIESVALSQPPHATLQYRLDDFTGTPCETLAYSSPISISLLSADRSFFSHISAPIMCG